MKNYIFGYARVSTEQQNLDRQLDALKKYGCDLVYDEKMTGTRRDRPELTKLLDRVTEGDTIVIESLSRLGRSTKDLIELTEIFEKKGVHLLQGVGRQKPEQQVTEKPLGWIKLHPGGQDCFMTRVIHRIIMMMPEKAVVNARLLRHDFNFDNL